MRAFIIHLRFRAMFVCAVDGMLFNIKLVLMGALFQAHFTTIDSLGSVEPVVGLRK